MPPREALGWRGLLAGWRLAIHSRARPHEDTQALSGEEVTELTRQADQQDETGAPERVAETENTAPIESSDQLGGGAPQPFIPEEAPSFAANTNARVGEAMYSTDEEGTDSGEPGDFKRGQEAAEREPRAGKQSAAIRR